MSLESALIARQDPGSLVRIAREARLSLAHERVKLTWIDEASIALVDAAISRGRSLTLVYPAPVGQVAVLLAAQILIHRLITRNPAQSVGLVTADPAAAEHTWKSLSITSPGNRSYLKENYPSSRARPDGQSPVDGHGHGLLIGRRCQNWRVDVLIIDHLAGDVMVASDKPHIRILSNPLDPLLEDIANHGDLIWAWCGAQVREFPAPTEADSFGVPFSAAEERLANIAAGEAIAVAVCPHPSAERAIEHLRDDLLAFGTKHPDSHRRAVVSGLKRAWTHTSTLCSLPCRPVEYDRFCGIPPVAARPTSDFHREIEAWGQSLAGR